ncbi:MAG: septum formation initiator family protein [Christensenellales bacterium]|uniref:Septum formation initiator family protein n=1 Tax=Candidatus Avichristensenella intestinipullorum TaxID=2840693 RepID=A0A9D0YZ16_9FIRM|nr:septum formation initiator family protein [Christensenellales bacterium]HIQ64036.1 septum formation initiator family protein [Candidatus Avichristensenella intestinipullorum]
MPAKETLRRQVTVRPKFLLVVLLPLALIFLIAAVVQRGQISRLRTELEEVRVEVQDAYSQMEELERRLSFTETDEYIEQEARRRFGLINPGEVRFVIEEGTPDASAAQPTPAVQETVSGQPAAGASPAPGGT